MKSFLATFGALISLVLSGFDRLRVRGEARWLNNPQGVDAFLYSQNVRYVDFKDYASEWAEKLREQTKRSAEEQGVPVIPLNSPFLDKEAIALINQRSTDQGVRHHLLRSPFLSRREIRRKWSLTPSPRLSRLGSAKKQLPYFPSPHPTLSLKGRGDI